MEAEIRIYFTEKHILFEFDNTIVLSRLIEGEYYKINQMLSGDYILVSSCRTGARIKYWKSQALLMIYLFFIWSA